MPMDASSTTDAELLAACVEEFAAAICQYCRPSPSFEPAKQDADGIWRHHPLTGLSWRKPVLCNAHPIRQKYLRRHTEDLNDNH